VGRSGEGVERYQTDVNRVAEAGLRDASRILAGIRARLRRALQQGHPPKAGAVRSILLHELVPSLARTMAVAKMIGMSRSKSDSKEVNGLSLAWDESKHPRDPGGEGGGQFVSKSDSFINKALDEIPKRFIKLLTKAGVRFALSERSDVKAHGGAAYLKFQGVIAYSKVTDKDDLIHEIGHALDHSMVSKVKITERTFDTRNKYWSDSLRKELAADKIVIIYMIFV